MAWHSTWNEQPEPTPRGGWLVDRGGFFPPAVKLILIVTVAVYVLAEVFGARKALFQHGELTVVGLAHVEIWRVVTYMFLHASGNHILINMLAFVMLGGYLERQIGSRPFLALYFACGIAGALCEVAFNLIMYQMYGPVHLDITGSTFLTMPTVGASAGVAGVLVGFATLNPREKLLVFFILPVEAWWVAMVYVLYETWPLVNDLRFGPAVMRDDMVAHAAHFGGMVVGFLWIKWGFHFADRLRGLMVTDRPTHIDRDPREEVAEENRILDKIHARGIDSLTTSEKMFLQEMSRKRRGR